ncbi:MAG: alpha/beta fold hydrolase, partial [Verrucomicrobiaceae bacterium]
MKRDSPAVGILIHCRMISVLVRLGCVVLPIALTLTSPLWAGDFTTQVHRESGPYPTTQDGFGTTVAVSGNTAVVGAALDGGGALFAGAAYVYVKESGTWTLQATLRASIPVPFGFFGFALAIDGDTIAIGELGGNAVGGSLQEGAGLTHVFVRSNGEWSQQAKLQASNAYAGNLFGSALAIEGDTLVVGSMREDGGRNDTLGEFVEDSSTFENRAESSGAAYVFTRAGTAWTEQAYLKALDTTNEILDNGRLQKRADEFGLSIAIENGTIAIGAPGANRGVKIEHGRQISAKSYEAGAVYTFGKQGGKWRQMAKLTSPTAAATDSEMFGESISLSGGTLVVGAPYADTGVPRSGAAFVYEKSGGGWAFRTRLQAGNADSQDRFGSAVGISGRALWVGATGESGSASGINGDGTLNDRAESGAVYGFSGDGASWTQEAYIKASGAPNGTNLFGRMIALSGKEAIVSTGGFEEAYFFSAEKPKPVIFIHGVAGSVLRGGGNTIWPTIFRSDVAALNLQTGPGDTEAIDVVRQYDVGGVGVVVEPVYGPFIRYMTDKLGHVEYELEGQRSRITSFHMLNQTFDEKPTFFVFPYDWRKPNASHMPALRQYIQNIRQLHGGEKVNLVVHSMGGLVMRRYLLEHGTEDIGNVVTVGSPIWGAPEVSHRMLTGNFFGKAPIDFINNKPMKDAILTMPAVHELLPSSLYHQHWGFPLFQERNVDFNNNGLDNEGYDTSQFRSMVDKEASPASPSLGNIHFHGFAGGRQDDWSADDSSVNFLHVVGKQAVDKTTVGVEVESRLIITAHDSLFTPYPAFRFNKVPGEGDGTVPILSSQRLPQYLPPGAIMRAISEPLAGVGSDNQPAGTSAEHTGLMSNHQVLGMIAKFLESGALDDDAPTPSPRIRRSTSSSVPSLAEALDDTSRPWNSYGDAEWTGQMDITHDGIDAARSGGNIGDGQLSILATSLEGPGTLSAWVKIESSGDGDELQVKVDELIVPGVDLVGEHDWRKIDVDVPEGSHSLTLTHMKHDTANAEDGVWLDEMSYVRNLPEILITDESGESMNDGISTLDFGSLRIGGSKTLTLTISNEGNVPLTGIAASLEGTGAEDFTLGSAPSSLAPGAAAALTVTCSPQAGRAHARSADLRIASSDGQRSEIVMGLSGRITPGRRLIHISGTSYLHIRDENGAENTMLSEIAVKKIPGVEIVYGGEEPWMSIETDTAREITLTNEATGSSLEIEIIETDTARLPVMTWRYRFDPQDRKWILNGPALTGPSLLVDTDGDGQFSPGEEIGTIHAAAGSAIDLNRPEVTLQISRSGANVLLELSGSDQEGAATIRYSIDGGAPQPYTGPLSFPSDTAAGVKVYAEDAAGNISGLIETALQPALKIGRTGSGTGSLELRWPVADGY